MQIKCVIDNTRTVKSGSKITLALDDAATKEVLRHLYNFVDKPLTVEIQVDASEQQARLAQISEDQRKKIYKLFKEIAESTGDNSEAVKLDMKRNFREAYDYPDFSLSNCEKELASEFISYIIAVCLRQSIALSKSPLEIVDDLTAYMYVCLQYKKCVICGKDADCHHVDAIGMGRNRATYDDRKHKKIALCRTHHTQAHTIGWETFANKYHVEGVVFAGSTAQEETA